MPPPHQGVSTFETWGRAALADALKDLEIVKKLDAQGVEPALMTPAQFTPFITTESAKFGKIVTEANVTVEN